MTGISICDIDFEKWATLASSDPQGFEQLRHDKISAYINRASGDRQLRLRSLQWRIDLIRNKNKNSAMAACLAISELMWDTFEQLRDLLQSQADGGLYAPLPHPVADIIPFPGGSKVRN